MPEFCLVGKWLGSLVPKYLSGRMLQEPTGSIQATLNLHVAQGLAACSNVLL